MRFIVRLVSLVAVALGLLGMAAAGADSNTVLVGRIEGVINPITARYVDRILDEAVQRQVTAVVFVVDTPGGLIDSTYKITARFLAAGVPIVTYVAPAGSRAASAGTFITMAGHVAAMAPSTNIGAAHPVDSSGGDIQGDLRLKAENDAVAHIVNIAKARGRNEQWAEDAVRKSVSIGSDDAVKIGVVDVIASDVNDLLVKIDGRKVTTAAGTVTLATKVALIAGTIILFPPLRPTFPGLRADVDPVVIATVALVSGAFFFFVARFAISTRQLAWAGGSPALVGATGVAKSDIGPIGVAYVAGEDWSARSEGGAIPRGSAVRVKRREGLSLIVEPSDSSPGRGAS